MSKYLWINLVDISHKSMRVGSMGNIINFMVSSELGDRILDGAVSKPGGNVDEQYIIIECADETRPQAITDALELVGKRKIGRKIRTRATAGPPTSTWTWR